ncbi:hypothetical protein [Facilibium subflavum]|uniref:hypothetical protein n=1 Tax=Facilibium subflavum TaxID=2219058 RepID=UPI000E64D3F3|nr:hypothetical protein [Facilibium subflavum]
MRLIIKHALSMLACCMLISNLFAADDSQSATNNTKVISSGDKSLSLTEQLSGVSPPVEKQKPQVAQVVDSTPSFVGNEAEIADLQRQLQNAFNNADKEAKDFSKPQQYMLFLLYKQAQQNQLILKQNNEIILSLRHIEQQNAQLLSKKKY